MKQPSDMTLGHRIMLTVIICVVVLLALALVGWALGRWEDRSAQAEQQAVFPSKYEAHLVQLDRAAMDEAYKRHLMRLFDVWVTDQFVHGKPVKGLTGANNARAAYTAAIEAIEVREKRLKDEEERKR